MLAYVYLHNTIFAFHGHIGVESRLPGMANWTLIKDFVALLNSAENAPARIKKSRSNKGEKNERE
jgi:hypothetical protein